MTEEEAEKRLKESPLTKYQETKKDVTMDHS